MKRCPTCQKEFPDSMRFCQTDGTPLGEGTTSEPLEDPFKTVVGQPPPLEDPFKTVVGGGSGGGQFKDNDILQLPEEPADPMKTMVVPPADWQKAESSATSSSPGEPSAPEPPKFSEPDLNPPAFGDLSPQPPRPTGDILGSSGGSSSSSSSSGGGGGGSSSSDAPGAPGISDSPFGQPPTGSPFQSPFEQQKSSFEPPPSPFDAPSAPPFDAPKPPPFKEPESPFGSGSGGSGQTSPFDQSPFSPPPGASSQAGSDPFAGSTPQAEWNPPPAPMQNWQDQNLGANTPFQPPPAAAGQNSTLAIVSLVLGIFSFFCLGIFASIPAIILGYMQRNNIRNNPSEYGGGGMAMAGMILGGINLALSVIFIVIWLLLVLSGGRF